MRIYTLSALVLAAIVPAGASYAKDAATEATTQEATPPKEKLVCKTERFVGSNIPSRVCKTKAEWEQGKIDAKRSLNRPPSRRMRDAEPPGAIRGG